MNNFSPVSEELTLITTKELKNTVHETLQYILTHTTAEFEKIISHKKINGDLTEALARPNYEYIPHIRDNKKFTTGVKKKEALYYLLDLVEKNNLTFDLFAHNLLLVKNEIEATKHVYKKYAVNAYPADIEHPYFIQSIQNFEYSKYLVIELTEKHQWSKVAIENLKYVQEKFGVEIAMDDIHPIPSAENMSMDSLQKFQEHGLTIDRHKMDGPFFQEMYHQYKNSATNDYNIFFLVMNHVINAYNMKKITIEWIENQQQYDFALRLEKELPEIEFRYQGFYFNENS